MPKITQRITPFLWFNNQAEDAVKFYTSIFKNSKAGAITHYPAGTPGPAGTVMTAAFQLDGQEFVALNGGPEFPFTEAVSFVINCETQEEIDYYWRKLSAGGGEVQCGGWLKDKFGVSWQVVPRVLGELISGKDPAKAQRVMHALLKMVKLDIKKLQEAAKKK